MDKNYKKNLSKQENNKIKVWMQYPWKYTDSSYYKYLLNYPPENIQYLNTKASKGVIIKKKGFLKSHKLKQKIKKIIRKVWPSMPNAHFTRTRQDYDLIHCAHCLSLNRKKPWVADIEYIGQLWASGPGQSIKKPNKKSVEKILRRKNCKKILAWTEWTKSNLEKHFPEINNKIELLYPAIAEQKSLKQRESVSDKDKITLLFISRRFYFKGGLYAVEVMNELTKKYRNVQAIVISDTPNEIIDKYKDNKKIQFLELMPQEKIFKEIYPKTDIFVYPAWSDTFGFGFMEALAFGLPVIGIQGHCNDEIIENEKTGFLIGTKKQTIEEGLKTDEIKKDFLEKIIEKTELLIKNPKLRKKMSENALKEIKEGKFSIKKRNEKLKRIYEEALK